MPPTLLMVIHGCVRWKSARTPFSTPSSRLVKPLHTLIVTGVRSAAALAASGLPESPPPQPAATTTTPVSAAAMARLRRARRAAGTSSIVVTLPLADPFLVRDPYESDRNVTAHPRQVANLSHFWLES